MNTLLYSPASSSYNLDILDCLSNLSTDEVFTPPRRDKFDA